MRRQSLVAGSVLTAVLVTLVALPGAVGSQTPSSTRPRMAAAFQEVRLPVSAGASPQAIRPLDAGYESAGHVTEAAPLVDPGAQTPPIERSPVAQPNPKPVVIPAPTPRPTASPRPTPSPARATPTARPSSTPVPTKSAGYRSVLSGIASWYDNGTTAMRLPRGTEIRICGAGGCITTVVRDWGPAAYLSDRIVDMTPSDFVRVTGRSLGTGLAPVKVYVY